ncbi:AfsR/SARP family transcriptional regulator [Salininema proteolyticum]|uniref:BTAD domain-containing putative transcriptional regulator n=1 Tax=Salininema proteolyticum TaxID=1607685 RepID=A0ABV8TY10_9ACTN
MNLERNPAPERALSLQLFGDVRLDFHGNPQFIGGPQHRALLAMLVLSGDKPLPSADIVAGLWGDEPPKACRQYVRNLITAIRKSLAHTGIVISFHGGYVLELPEDTAVDYYRVSQLARWAAAAASRHIALRLSTRALELSRVGIALNTDVPFARRLRGHWRRQRELILENKLTLLVMLGRGRDARDELSDLARDHPFQERLHTLLMLALVQSNQPLEAELVYVRFKQRLQDAKGLAPSPELLRLYRRIWVADSSPEELFEHVAQPEPIG